MKKVVKYTEAFFPMAASGVVVGHSAWVVPVDHPDEEYVTNGQMALTSRVVSYDETTCIFETMNTVYIPA